MAADGIGWDSAGRDAAPGERMAEEGRSPQPRRWFLVLVLAVLVAACSGDDEVAGGRVESFADARALWDEVDVTSYGVELVIWNVFGGTTTCQVAVEGGESRVLDDVPVHPECERLAKVPEMFAYAEEQLDGEGWDSVEFDDRMGNVVLLRTQWDSLGDDRSEIIVRLRPTWCGDQEPCFG